MSSVPDGSSLRTLPPNDISDGLSPRQSLLSQSLSRRDYSSITSSSKDSKEGSGSSLISPIIDEEDVDMECGTYLQRSMDSLDRRRARTAASTLQRGNSEGLETAEDEEWYEIANPTRRKEHLTR